MDSDTYALMLKALECAEDLRHLADAVNRGDVHAATVICERQGLSLDQSEASALSALAEKSAQLRHEALAAAKGE